MSEDEADPELLALLAKSLGFNESCTPPIPEICVLKDAEYIYNSSLDVAIDMKGTKSAASSIWNQMRERKFSAKTWSEHELHPKSKDESTVDFIFLMDLLNFSFWSDGEGPNATFAIEYCGKRRTGYWSLVACINRALEEGVPITSPEYWVTAAECTDDVLRHVFRSDTSASMPLMEERILCMREAGRILTDRFTGTFVKCIKQADGSAAALVNLVVDNFASFNDRHRFEDQTVAFHKRAQILVADLWACFDGEGYGHFSDIDQITMFAGKFARPEFNLMDLSQIPSFIIT